MSDSRDFHAALSHLAYARAENTVQYVLEEARRIDEGRKAKAWHELTDIQIADRLLIADLMCDPCAGHCFIEQDGIIRNVNGVTADSLGQPCKQRMIGTSVFDYMPATTGAYRREVGKRVLATGQPLRFTDRNRQGRPIESITVPMSNNCLMVLFRPVLQGRVFEEAFSDQGRVIE